MITQVSVKNFLLIKETTLNFDNGFTVFSGESGAGKSLLFKAIRFCLGGKVDRGYIGAWGQSAVVSIQLTPTANAMAWLEGKGFQSDQVMLKHTLQENKRQAWLNDKRITLTELRVLAKQLVLDSQQSQSLELRQPEYQKQYIDSLLPLDDLQSYQEVKASYQIADKRFKEMEATLSQADDVSALDTQIDELETTLSTMNYEDVQSLMDESHNIRQIEKVWLGQKDQVAMMHKIKSRLARELQTIELPDAEEALSRMDTELESLTQAFSEAMEISSEIKQRLETAQQQIARFNDLSRKYRVPPKDLEAHYEALVQRRQQILDAQQDIQTVSKDRDSLKKQCLEKTTEIMDLRRKASEGLALTLSSQLVLLGLERAVFQVEWQDEGIFGEQSPLFMIKSNPGQPFKTLADCLSGGELSRLALLLLLNVDDSAVIILDEVDTGVSGEAAIKIRTLLQDIAKDRQVLCISHLAQVASGANNHFLVQKTVIAEKAQTEIIPLSQEERPKALSLLLSGKNDALAVSQAKALLDIR